MLQASALKTRVTWEENHRRGQSLLGPEGVQSGNEQKREEQGAKTNGDHLVPCVVSAPQPNNVGETRLVQGFQRGDGVLAACRNGSADVINSGRRMFGMKCLTCEMQMVVVVQGFQRGSGVRPVG